MSRRDLRMPFTKWVDTHVRSRRALRLQAIMMLLGVTGALSSYDIQEGIARAGVPVPARTEQRAHTTHMRASIDTIQRDLKLLVEQGYVRCIYPPLESARYEIPSDTLVGDADG